jgi:hypothetical protein
MQVRSFRKFISAYHEDLTRPQNVISIASPATLCLRKLEVLDDDPVKPTRIWSRVGRRPILAAGNSNGDIEMLRFAEHPLRQSLSLLVYHDDAEREFAYDAGAQRSLEIARERGWTIVSMRDDWKTVYDVEH